MTIISGVSVGSNLMYILLGITDSPSVHAIIPAATVLLVEILSKK